MTNTQWRRQMISELLAGGCPTARLTVSRTTLYNIVRMMREGKNLAQISRVARRRRARKSSSQRPPHPCRESKHVEESHSQEVWGLPLDCHGYKECPAIARLGVFMSTFTVECNSRQITRETDLTLNPPRRVPAKAASDGPGMGCSRRRR